MQYILSHIILYIKRADLIYGLLFSIIVTLSLCLVFLIYNPATPEQGVLSVWDLVALGPESEVTAGWFVIYQQAVIEMLQGVDGYGRFQEDLMGAGVKQLILEYSTWLQFYIKIRKNMWLAFEEQRAAAAKTIPTYDVETSPLIMDALRHQSMAIV